MRLLAVCILVTSAALSTGVGTAHAAEGDEDLSARDLVYEAADAIDAATEELRSGRDLAADRLLNRAEDFLNRAERLDPNLSSVAYQKARLYKVDGEPDTAEEILLGAMRGSMEIGDHVQAVSLLDGIRGDLGRPSVRAEWGRATATRDAGIGLLIAGGVASVVGYGVAFSSLSSATYAREPVDDARQQAGLAIAAAGGGVLLGGGVTILVGQGKVAKLEGVLPGPWRLAGGKRTAEAR